MKILAIIIQNKSGENIFVVSSNNLSHESTFRYSTLAYDTIKKNNYQNSNDKINNTLQLDNSIVCVFEIQKEIIIEVLVANQDIYIGTEAILKLKLFFPNDQKIEQLYKKYSEIFMTLEEFLYTREINNSKFTLQNKTKFISSKKYADTEVYNSFVHAKQGLEKNLIANIPLKNQQVLLVTEQQQEFINATIDNFSIEKDQNKVLENQRDKYKGRINYQRNLRFFHNLNQTNMVGNKTKQQSSIKNPNYGNQNSNKKNVQRQSYVGYSSEQFQQQLQNKNNNIQDILNQQQKQNFQLENNDTVDLLGLDEPVSYQKPKNDIKQENVTKTPAIQLMTQSQKIEPTKNRIFDNSHNINLNQPINLLHSVQVQKNQNFLQEELKTQQIRVKSKIFDNVPLNNNEQINQNQNQNQNQMDLQNQNANNQQQQQNYQQRSPGIRDSQKKQKMSIIQNDVHLPAQQINNSNFKNLQNNNNNGILNFSNSQQVIKQQNSQQQNVNLLDLMDFPQPPQSMQQIQMDNSNYSQDNRQKSQSQAVQDKTQNQTPIKNIKKTQIIQNSNSKTSSLDFPKVPTVQKPPSVKIMEKMMLMQKDGKIKDVKLIGQLLIAGDFKQEVIDLQLLGDNWQGEKRVNKRKNPQTLPIKDISNTQYKIKVNSQNLSQPKPIFDYIIPPSHYFNPNLIPLYFLYKQENHPQKKDTRFNFQYKVNEKWDKDIFDVDIGVVFNEELIFEDIKIQPQANSFQNKTVTWTAPQLNPNIKGKLGIQLEGVNKNFQEILSYIKISLRSNNELASLDAKIILNQEQQQQQDNIQQHSHKKLIAEYKIFPNELQ